MKKRPGARRRNISNRIERKKAKRGAITLTRKEMAAQLEKQRQARRQSEQRKKSATIRDKFKPTKKDKGTIVFVGLDGKKLPPRSRRKGIPVFVSKTGKKQLVKQAGRKGYLPTKPGDAEIPLRKNLRKAAKKFEHSRRVTVKKGKAKRPIVKGAGTTKIRGAYDFNDKVVSKLSKDLKRVLERQASQRRFLIAANVLVELPDGLERVYSFEVTIERGDHHAIKLAGLENFVRMKFYAFMARELQFDGYVTSGSANHIRSLKENKGKPESKWVQDDGEAWRGREAEIVKIRNLEWELQQMK